MSAPKRNARTLDRSRFLGKAAIAAVAKMFDRDPCAPRPFVTEPVARTAARLSISARVAGELDRDRWRGVSSQKLTLFCLPRRRDLSRQTVTGVGAKKNDDREEDRK